MLTLKLALIHIDYAFEDSLPSSRWCALNYLCLFGKHPCTCLCVCCFCIHVSRLPKPFKPNVSTDLSSVLTQRALLLSALFSELSQGVKEEHITAEDGSSLSGLAQEEESVRDVSCVQ